MATQPGLTVSPGRAVAVSYRLELDGGVMTPQPPADRNVGFPTPRGRVKLPLAMVELEARYEVQGRPVLVVGWFEGSGTGRIVVTGPNKLREDIQVSLDLSLRDEVQEAMAEPPPGARPGATVRAHFSVVTDQGRATRSTDVSGTGTLLDVLCVKLLSMAEMMVRAEPLKKIVEALKARCR